MNSHTPATDRRDGEPESGAHPQPVANGLASLQHQLRQTLVADLRTDHAGESGAVMIYRGILAITRHASVRHFAQAHLATEARHLAQIEPLLPPQQRSRLLPLWHVAGWLTGALPALTGPRAVYATIEAVETFVDQHYAEQIESIDRHDPHCTDPALQSVRALLEACRSDEIAHRDEAAALLAVGGDEASLVLRAWVWSVGAGSRVAVKICRWI
jgi:3-demethoxyubiquinol 3-hydroxylase